MQAEREIFLDGLVSWTFEQDRLFILGNFNCVLNPPLDLLGHVHSSRAESLALVRLLDETILLDARILRDNANDEKEDPVTDHFTCWTRDQASHIDRFYVPALYAHRNVWVSTRPPPLYSDHQEVNLHLRDKQTSTNSASLRHISYPIRINHPDRVIHELLDILTHFDVVHNVTTSCWDRVVSTCLEVIRQVRRRVRQRHARFLANLCQRDRARFHYRHDCIAANIEKLWDAHLSKLGRHLERSTAQIRWPVKPAVDWERDQTVTAIVRRHGSPCRGIMSIADQFASEWEPILGVNHWTEVVTTLSKCFSRFTIIPRHRQVSAAGNTSLMAAVREAEVLIVVRALSHYKASGPNGLNNDFYKDTAAIMVPALVAVSNHYLGGRSDMPNGNCPGLWLYALQRCLRRQITSLGTLQQCIRRHLNCVIIAMLSPTFKCGRVFGWRPPN